MCINKSVKINRMQGAGNIQNMRSGIRLRQVLSSCTSLKSNLVLTFLSSVNLIASIKNEFFNVSTYCFITPRYLP
jgi:hypothetical protein